MFVSCSTLHGVQCSMSEDTIIMYKQCHCLKLIEITDELQLLTSPHSALYVNRLTVHVTLPVIVHKS